MKKTFLLLLFALLGLAQAVAQEYDYLPVAREGVKWVNEKVIVNHGDTTSYYYTYEFCGEDTAMTGMSGRTFKALYYYLGDKLDVEKDSLIAGLLDSGRLVSSLRNNPYDLSWANGTFMFRLGIYGDGTLLYWFNSDFIVRYYLDCQTNNETEFFLTEDNFYITDPITIDGKKVFRAVYVDEQGNPLAYVIPGIGFDSRDMGDLLTPFTRQPDPNADYQEWCGLSHVVKDGQIIYKGMRYRPGVLVGIDEAMADRTARPTDPQYSDLMGRAVGTDVPSTPGIYIHQGRKIVVSRMP